METKGTEGMEAALAKVAAGSLAVEDLARRMVKEAPELAEPGADTR